MLRALTPLCACVALALAPTALAADDVRYYRGNARDLRTGEALYSENHEEHYAQGRHVYSVVRYRDPSEKEICRKTISFRNSRAAADFRIDDLRDGYMEAASVEGRTLRLHTRKTRRHALREKKRSLPQPCVIDGGFDYFIRDNWDKLVRRGQTLTFRFVAANKLDHYGFRLRKVGTTTVAGIRCVRLKLAATGLLARLFVDPITVAYDLDRKRLMEYRGMTNINDAKGKSHKARIVFTYPWMEPAEPRK